jgi:hypothetical protein
MLKRGILVAMLCVGTLGGALGAATWGAFSSLTSNSSSYAAGTVYLTDNDLSARMLSLLLAKPAGTASSCIAVTYSGTLNSSVRLYLSSLSGTIAPYLTLTVTRGTDSVISFPSCANFTADATNYIGAGNGVIYSGLLSAFPTTYAAGLVDPTSGTPATWSTTNVHSYKFTVTLNNDPAAQATAGAADVTWEARNQ